MVEGFNVSNNGPTTSGNTRGTRIAHVVAVSGQNVEISCTVFSGTGTDLGGGFETWPHGKRSYTFSRAVFSDANEDRAVFPTSYKYVANTGAWTV